MNQLKIKNRHPLLCLVLGLVIAFGISILGCKKDGVNDEANKDDYYVKYEVNSSTIYYGGTLNVIATGADNQNATFTVKTKTAWETTIGPVKKGFKAHLQVTQIEDNYGHLTLQTQISVSKNSSPFALKQKDDSNTSRTSAALDYTIDY